VGWYQRLSDGLTKTRDAVRESVDRLLRRGLTAETLEELEAALLGADVGVRTVATLLERVRQRPATDAAAVETVLVDSLADALRPAESPPIERLIEGGPKPFVVLAVGVNGVGKTTTLAKLAQRLAQAGKRPLLVAADTFRAAATEQLQEWARRVGVDIIRHQQGADPSAVVFDGIAAARARGADVVLIDTAGRLHTKANLMDELRKVKRIIARELPGAPHEVLLVLDATVGQNAVAQARQFHEAVGVTGLAVTKLDGSARGGVLVAITDAMKLPVRLIGVGESVEDLQDFHPAEYAAALLRRPEEHGRTGA
jgi:fused signal recognition particle receptor